MEYEQPLNPVKNKSKDNNLKILFNKYRLPIIIVLSIIFIIIILASIGVFSSKDNKIEIFFKGATGDELFTVEDLNKKTIVSENIATKDERSISFKTSLPSIIINFYNKVPGDKDLFITKILKNGTELIKTPTKSVIRGDLIFEEGNTRRQAVNNGEFRWENSKYQIDIGT